MKESADEATGRKFSVSMVVSVDNANENLARYDASIRSFVLSDLGDMYCRHETLYVLNEE